MDSPPPATTPAVDLFRQLGEDATVFDFFQAVRRIECVFPNQPRIGTSTRAAQDPVRFTQNPSLAFAPSSITSFTAPAGEDRPAQLAVNFIGMWGPNGPLPQHLTEYARDRLRSSNDPTLARFMDVFHHRMTSLFYRAWAVCQQAVGSDRTATVDAAEDASSSDRIAAYVASFIGRGTASLRARDAVPDGAKLYWAGHLASETAHAEGLESILTGHFGFPCQVQPFGGMWIDIPNESRCRLGRSKDTSMLGQTVVVGAQVWDAQGKFGIRLGPMSLDQFTRMLPGQPGNRQLRDWIRNYVGDQLAWEANVVLAAQAEPGVRLGVAGNLGWSAWLPSQAGQRDRDDLILHS